MRRPLAKALREKWIAGAALDVYEREPLACRFAASRSHDCGSLPPSTALCERGENYAPVHRPRQRNGGKVCARADRRPRRKLRRRRNQDALRRKQGSFFEITQILLPRVERYCMFSKRTDWKLTPNRFLAGTRGSACRWDRSARSERFQPNASRPATRPGRNSTVARAAGGARLRSAAEWTTKCARGGCALLQRRARDL